MSTAAPEKSQTVSEAFDKERADRFAERMLEILNHGATALMISIGHRSGLFDNMAELSFASSGQIAGAAQLNPRYVREWLGAMTTAGIVQYRPEDRTYQLPAEHAAFLTRAAEPNNIAAVAQLIPECASIEEEAVAAFRHGRGIPYSSYKRFHEVMAEDSGQTVVAALREHILPLVPKLTDRLEQGIDVLDVGCGSGRAMNKLAAEFPRSHFTGIDFSEEGISRARAETRLHLLPNVRFEVQDAADLVATRAYDLITAFDAIHDQARPAQVLANIYAGLRPGGTFLMQDIAASTFLENNLDHPIGPFLYTISCLHCMSVSLAAGGAGLGAMWGKEKALEMLAEAGFRQVRVEQLPHDFQNYYYVAGKSAAT
ncbi:MAG TPA: class I SAM-dependent methyltransferase [Chthoniobacterales bacterium]|nr:class I SAM-dependent methyltransferase [Chthoniobacterales bacterium]